MRSHFPNPIFLLKLWCVFKAYFRNNEKWLYAELVNFRFSMFAVVLSHYLFIHIRLLTTCYAYWSNKIMITYQWLICVRQVLAGPLRRALNPPQSLSVINHMVNNWKKKPVKIPHMVTEFNVSSKGRFLVQRLMCSRYFIRLLIFHRHSGKCIWRINCWK